MTDQELRQVEIQALNDLTAAVKQMSVVLATFAEHMMDLAHTSRQMDERSKEVFGKIRQDILRSRHGDTTEPTR
jgi:hypothetical protein